MNIQEAIKKSIKIGKPIKRKGWNYWIEIVGNNSLIKERKSIFDKIDLLNDIISLSIDDILANDWEVKNVKEVKKEWYEVENFRETYPNGVLCYVSNDGKEWHYDIITDYAKWCSNGFLGELYGYSSYNYTHPLFSNLLPDILIDNNQVINIKDLIRRLETKVSK